MAKDQVSVAPKERVNITYRSATGGASEEIELPLKVLMLGDFTCRADDAPIEDRKPISVDKDNFTEVMAQQNLCVDINVSNKLTGEDGSQMPVSLRFNSTKDFEPEGIVQQVPELRQLLELRAALSALKGPLGNLPAFRKKIQSLLASDEARDKLMQEIGAGNATLDSEG